jgi:hypothetical protein
VAAGDADAGALVDRPLRLVDDGLFGLHLGLLGCHFAPLPSLGWVQEF